MKVLAKTNNILLVFWLWALWSMEMINNKIANYHPGIISENTLSILSELTTNEVDFDRTQHFFLVVAGKGLHLE